MTVPARSEWGPCSVGQWERLGALLAARRRARMLLSASLALLTSAVLAAGAWGVASAISHGSSSGSGCAPCGQEAPCTTVPPTPPK
jgi:hypothetical protein